MPQIEIRDQRPDELDVVLDICRRAFGDEGDLIARLVTDLQGNDCFTGHSWVAELDGAPVGHVMLTRGWIDADRALVECPVLSPLSVLPERHGTGVGSALVRYAVARADETGAPGVVLEGDPAYYSRLGFEPCEDRGVLRPSVGIPERAFQWVRCAAYEPWMRGRFVYPDRFWAHDSVGLRALRGCGTGLTVSTVTLGARDVPRLVRFYSDLLGRPLPDDLSGDWVSVHDDAGGVSVAVQHEPDQEPVVWPAGPGEQHMQVHLEVRADSLEAGVAHALSCGATLAARQDQDDVRVMLDPEGHPFCVWVET